MQALTVADGSITTDKIADGAITSEKLAPDLSLIPPGTIVMWSGSLSEIPDGWALCDGTSGTPDLRDRFILSVSAGENPGGIGGSHSQTLSVANLPPHTHSFTTDPAGNHRHNVKLCKDGSPSSSRQPSSVSEVANRDYYSEYAGEHTHSGTTNSTGSGTPFDVRPRYYKLAFIMKLP